MYILSLVAETSLVHVKFTGLDTVSLGEGLVNTGTAGAIRSITILRVELTGDDVELLFCASTRH